MDKLRATCVQANASILIGTIETIFQISLDRTSHLRQLTADLMMPPRLQIDLQQIIIIRMGDQFITQDGFLGIRPLGIVSVTLILLLVPHQPIHQLTLIPRGRFLTIAQYVLRTSPTRNISFKRERALLVLAKITTPLTGRSRRCVTPTRRYRACNTSPSAMPSASPREAYRPSCRLARSHGRSYLPL